MSAKRSFCRAACLFSLTALCFSQSTQAGIIETIQIEPTEDTFSRINEPTATYGQAGALHVAGSQTLSTNGQPEGESDTWIKFNTSAAVQQFDMTFGAGNWAIDSVTLNLLEALAPAQHPFFGRGTGDFAVNWITNDDWSEGFGAPGGGGSPGTASGNQIGWTYGQSILSAGDRSLGTFQNAGTDTLQSFSLSLDADFIADITAPGPDLTLRLTAASDLIGFTFRASETSGPRLDISAVAIPEPATALLMPVALAFVMRKRRQIR